MDKNSHYYTMAQLSKVIKSGANRIKSYGDIQGIYHSAFINPDGSYSIVMLNENSENSEVTVKIGNDAFKYNIPAQSAASFIWKR